VSFQSLDKSGLTQGVVVNAVVKGSPAATAGMQPGDVLLKVGSTEVTARFAEEIPPVMQLLADLPEGKPIELTLRRKDEQKTLSLTPQPLQKDRGDERLLRLWGLTVEALTSKSATELRLDSADGVLITGVREGSPGALAEPPLYYGDVLRAIDGKPVKDLTELLAAYRTFVDAENGPETLLFEFDRRGENQLTIVKAKREKEDDPPREVPKGWIGVATQPLTQELATKLGTQDVRGFRVARVYPGTQAEKAGLKVGDVVTAINGDSCVPQGIQDAALFARMARRLTIGETTELELWRDGKKQSLKVPVERTRLTQSEARRDRNTDFDMTVRELTFFDRDDLRLAPETKGVLITGVDPAGWAGIGGLRTGDLVQSVDGRDVKDLASYRDAMTAVTKARPSRVVFVIQRGVRTRYQFLEPDWKPASAQKGEE
jgi:serine protease Do